LRERDIEVLGEHHPAWMADRNLPRHARGQTGFEPPRRDRRDANPT